MLSGSPSKFNGIFIVIGTFDLFIILFGYLYIPSFVFIVDALDK